MKKAIFALLLVATVLTSMSFSGEAEMASAYEPEDTYEVAAVNSVKPIQETDILESVSVKKAELIALCVMAEAEGECEYGQRLVIDVILNRVDDPHFPDTIYDVIYQENQFSGMYGDRITRCYVKDELVQLVREELENRTNYEVVFFRTGHYHRSYGVPMFQVGAHYFSSYD